jgi:heme exporter protein C
MEQNFFRKYWLPVLGGILTIVALWMVFLYVPTVLQNGHPFAQRIFYFHVPVDWVAFLSFLIVFIASIAYLRTRKQMWDNIAHSSAELGIVFTTLMLVTGMIWAKPAWGVYWVWDPRLTTALVLWFIYVAYLLVRSYAGEELRGARFAAVLGIVGFIDVPIVALAIVLWRTQHPAPVVFEGGLDGSQMATLMVSLAAFTCLFVTLLRARFSLRKAEYLVRSIEEE